MPVNHYFQKRATRKFHSEMGMPNIVTMDSLQAMMPESACGRRRACGACTTSASTARRAARRSASASRRATAAPTTSTSGSTLAQFVNYEGYRAMFEAQSRHRMGLLIWMSHPAWPSLRLADLRLLLRADGRLLRREEGL